MFYLHFRDDKVISWTDRVKKCNFPTQHLSFSLSRISFASPPTTFEKSRRAHCLLELCRNGQRLCHVIDSVGKGRNCALQWY